MRVGALIDSLPYQLLQGSIDTDVIGLAYDSREVKSGYAFFVLSGMQTEGAYYVEQAMRHGAVAIFVEKQYRTPVPVTVIQMEHTRQALSRAAAVFYGYPSRKMRMFGITGTKGKTSVAYMLKQIFEAAGQSVGVVGTMGVECAQFHYPTVNTTPESLDLQKILSDLEKSGVRNVVMEVSSQALKWWRVNDIFFDYGIVTNLYSDHIGPSEHSTFEDYRESKRKILGQAKHMIVNSDMNDAALFCDSSVDTTTYGWNDSSDLYADAISYDTDRGALGITIHTEGLASENFSIRAPGVFSSYNALAAIAVSIRAGIPVSCIKDALRRFQVAGRMERVLCRAPFQIYIDYAHNGASMEQVFHMLSAYVPREKIIALFGCGGNRSRVRRLEMGEVAGHMAGLSVITSDNSRYENTDDIIQDIIAGMQKTGGNYCVIPDRTEAIRYCLSVAKEGDIVLLLGKGHETYQELRGVRYPFDERIIVRSILKQQEKTKMKKEPYIIDGKKIAAELKEECREYVKDRGINACLAVILVGNDPASSVYVSNKKKACEFVGIRSLSYELPETTTQEELLELVEELNARADVHGILVQLPLPPSIDEEKVLLAIRPEKDVDGFHPMNVGALSIGKKGFVSCTPAGVIELLKRSNIAIEGKHCVVVGRSNIVGKPMALLLLRENGTVTITHSKTADLKSITRQADILVVAIGKPNFITADYVKEGATVIDVGIHRTESGKLCGDVAFDSVCEVAGAITPVPGGVGPMTIAMLMHNCVEAAKGE